MDKLFKLWAFPLIAAPLDIGAASAHEFQALDVNHGMTRSVSTICENLVIAQAANPDFVPNHPINLPPTKPVRGVIYHPVLINNGSGAGGAQVATHPQPQPQSNNARCSANPC